MGSGVEAMKYRFQWSYPLLFSPWNQKLLYAGANVLMATEDEAQHWKAISPDLTRDDKSKQGPVGGPITKTIQQSSITTRSSPSMNRR
jgi:hypothetical protein